MHYIIPHETGRESFKSLVAYCAADLASLLLRIQFNTAIHTPQELKKNFNDVGMMKSLNEYKLMM